MREILLALCMLSLTACVSEDKKISDNVSQNHKIKSSFDAVTENNFTINGMNYISFHYSGGGMLIINVTKDSLEVEYYKTQINVNNNYYGE